MNKGEQFVEYDDITGIEFKKGLVLEIWKYQLPE